MVRPILKGEGGEGGGKRKKRWFAIATIEGCEKRWKIKGGKRTRTGRGGYV